MFRETDSQKEIPSEAVPTYQTLSPAWVAAPVTQEAKWPNDQPVLETP